ncbi:MAG: phosphoribosylglycinamide formyltransferase [Candidatus Moranbacteria bacterium]|nr:phosphoribosylglycinamide formyltransferase [Candidatus Moranbacteria bacterium]
MKINQKKRLGVLISGNGTNLQNIIESCRAGGIDGEVVCVGSDKHDAYGLKRADNAGIPTFVLAYNELQNLHRTSPGRIGLHIPPDFNLLDMIQKTGFKDCEKKRTMLYIRAATEYKLLNQLKEFKVDFLVLAGFMKVFTPYFLDRFQPDPFKPRILNIHPALLPAFPGTDGYKDAWNYGVTTYGVTVHFVDYGTDTGPIIKQKALTREDNDNFESFKNRGLEAEYALYTRCIQLFIERRLKVKLGPNKERRIVQILQKK